ncbi:MAG: hypothetical protein HFE39_07660 [Clostridiales bacterium]|jgi:hypothetical protein|nr:hypothetical protein [Clostridiales bacterium]
MESLLLDELSQRCDVYISSLKYPDMRPQALRQLLQMDLSRFSLEECSYSITYLMGQNVSFSSYQEIDKYIQKATE